MTPDLQAQLVARVLAHFERGTTDSAPAPSTLPTAAYADEAAALFRRLPLAIGHASQLAAPGDYLTHDATGVPLLVVRGDDGKLAAFLNVCRHRGTRVEATPCGSKKAFVCPYHAWTYGRDGALRNIPHADGFAGHDGRGLVPIAVAELAGLIFVQREGVIAPAWLGPIAGELDGFGIARSHVYAPTTMTRELSWKLAIDIFLEAYHLQSAHRDSIYRLFFDNVGLHDPIGPHQRNVFPKRTIREAGELRRHANVLYHLFPNTLVLVEPDHAAVLHLWPLGAARTLLTSYTLVPEPPATDKARAYWDANNAILYNAVGEDFTLGESIQRGLASGANREVVFGAFEHGLAHFHAQIARYAGLRLARDAAT